MNSPMIPQTYEQWRHCVTVECGIPLTRSFIEARLAVWSSDGHEEVRRFTQLYGDDHRERVRGWFAKALTQLA